MWFNYQSESASFYSIVSLFLLLCLVAAQEYKDGGINASEEYDCSNRTHSWRSQHNSCLLDPAVGETSANQKQDVLESQKGTGRFVGGLGLRIRQSECAANQTRCWIVNCCDPGQICGAINVGCTYSYSTIYTTTTTSIWSTLTSLVIPGGASYTTTQVTETAYATTYKPVTLPGAGQNTILQTTTTTTTLLILSAYTPAPVQTTQTVSSDPAVTNAPKLIRDASYVQLPHAEIPRQVDSVRYTTITVYIQEYFTQAVASTLSSDALFTIQNTVTISSIATQNQTFYRTPTAFTTSTVTETITSKSYAYGSLAPATQTISITPSAPSSEVAGTTPTNTSDPSQSNPPGAYPPGGKHGLSSGAIAGLVVGIILALILLALLVVMLCCIRRKRNRRAGYDREVRNSRHLVDAPSPPSPPVPQMAMVSTSPHSSDESPSPPAEGAITRVSHRNGGNSRYGHGRKSSRSSVVSITPVPEEDEEELEQDRINTIAAAGRRNSGDSTRSWGRGYGGRGGYYGGAGGRPRNAETSSPTHHTFRGQTTTSYSDESLVPPHARGSQERL